MDIRIFSYFKTVRSYRVTILNFSILKIFFILVLLSWEDNILLKLKRGYDITQVLNLLEKVNIMSEETVMNIHYKIDNYKTESSWITGQNIKHFATAYMVYKVIAPFRYMVSLALVRSLVMTLRSKRLMK